MSDIKIAYTKLSPFNSGKRTARITRITPHCTTSPCKIADLGNLFSQEGYNASSNYGIDIYGYVGLFVPEDMRSWCSSSAENDQQAITIECASESKEPYTMTDETFESLVILCTDICKRYGKTSLLWIDDKDKALAYIPKDYEMLLTVHRWFAAKECPGAWLYSRLGKLASRVTARLNQGTIYRVQLGAFTSRQNAENYLRTVHRAGFPNAFITTNKL